MFWLYDLPHWLMGLIVVGVTAGGSLSAYVLISRRAQAATDEQKAAAFAILPIIATVHALLLAFMAISVWESFSAAETAVVDEASVIGQLARDLSAFDSGESVRARAQLRVYAQVVLEKEWPELQRGEPSREAWDEFDKLFRSVSAVEPDTPKRVALMPEIWGRTNDLVRVRRQRLHSATAEIPLTLWTVVLIGTVLTMAMSFVLPFTRFNAAMIGGLATSVGLVFFFLIAMDRPFAGREAVSSAPFQTALDNIDHWDRTAAP